MFTFESIKNIELFFTNIFLDSNIYLKRKAKQRKIKHVHTQDTRRLFSKYFFFLNLSCGTWYTAVELGNGKVEVISLSNHFKIITYSTIP